MNSNRYLRRNEAAIYLRSHYGYGSVKTLAKLACLGGGPVFRKAGKIVLYRTEELDCWAASRISHPMHSTSDTEVF